MATFSFPIPGATQDLGVFLNEKTKDQDLVYTGRDSIVWSRVNTERVRRGLPGLAETGYPRPVDSSKKGTVVEVKGPPGMTEAQARQIFESQFNSGTLVGVEVGTVISAATQSAQGLTAAAAQLGQDLSGRVGALGADIRGSVGQIGSLAAPGSLALSSSTVQNLTSSVQKATSGLALNNEINIANFGRSLSAVGPISTMNSAQVTSALATAQNLVAQAPSTLTNSGLGSFGFNASQLESAGVLKPGMSSLVTAGNSLSSVLKSPSAYTGKNGISSVAALLSNPMAQNTIQQNLMNNGMQELGKLSGGFENLPAVDTAGLSLAAASLAGQASALQDLAKGSLDTLPQREQILSQLKNAQYAVNLVNEKIPDSFKTLEIPLGVVNSVDRASLDAATSRIFGSAKIPDLNFSPSPSSIIASTSSVLTSISGNAAATSANFETSLFGKTKDQDLIYTGKDPIVWDRINRERLKRGLPGLAEIGYPRPPIKA